MNVNSNSSTLLTGKKKKVNFDHVIIQDDNVISMDGNFTA